MFYIFLFFILRKTTLKRRWVINCRGQTRFILYRNVFFCILIRDNRVCGMTSGDISVAISRGSSDLYGIVEPTVTYRVIFFKPCFVCGFTIRGIRQLADFNGKSYKKKKMKNTWGDFELYQRKLFANVFIFFFLVRCKPVCQDFHMKTTISVNLLKKTR